MKQIEVAIMGQSYVLGCPDGGEQQLRAAVATVDREMSAIREAGKVRARERIAVLASLNLAYALAGQPVAAAPASPEAAAEVDIDVLIERIDHALAARGQLL